MSSSVDHPEGREPAGPRRLAARLLAVPLFYKILVANAGIVVVFSLLATWLAVTVVHAGSPLAPLLALALAGAIVSIAVNGVIIQFALEPLRLLKRTVDRVQHGDVEARVPHSPLEDVEMQRLTTATNAMLDRLAQYRRRLRDVAARALNAAEEERRRVSLELHDDTSQRLAAILMRLRVARSVDDLEAKDAVLDEVRRDLAETADGLRRYAQGLRPPALDELGLAAAVESHVRTVGPATRARIEVVAEGMGRMESSDAELALYRIVQEAITNAIRHGHPERIRVELMREDGVVRGVVADDGVGFDVDATLRGHEEGRGLGLFGMRERALYVGGRVEIRSRPGDGTTVRAEVPAGGAATPL